MKKNDRNPRRFPVDLSLPIWACQNCHQNISDDNAAPSGPQGSSNNGSCSVMDQSFVNNQVVKGVPTCPRPGTMRQQVGTKHSHKTMEESYVVLPPPAASVYGAVNSPLCEQGSACDYASNNAGFSSKIKVLKRVFDDATSHTQVEQPLCLECMSVLSDNIDKEVEDVERDIEAYEPCLKKFEGEEQVVLSESDFLKEKLKAEEEERKLMAEINETEKQCAQVNATLKELEAKSTRFKELEERYWHEFNDFQFQLTSYQEEKDAVLVKTEVAQAHMELLEKTSVLKDAFPIVIDGEFCTINNFRLGRLPKVPVEWDEINAAWGQACLLLHAMCQYLRPKFQFGPVNSYWSTSYDKAMTLFLTCLKDFADFANTMDRDNNISAEKCFVLPYKIEDDKVHGYSIKHSFNKQENWTKSLKYTLCNLKWALYWFVSNTKTFQPLSLMASPSSSYIKHGRSSMSSSQCSRKAALS